MNIPNQPMAERSLLGGCILEGIASPCRPEDYYVANHRLIAQATIDLQRSGTVPDLVTVTMALQGKVPASEVVDLCSSMPSGRNIETYARIVRETAAARRLQALAFQFAEDIGIKNGKSDSDKITAFSGAVLAACDCPEHSRDTDMRGGIREFVSRFERRVSSGQPVTGFRTGIFKLDHYTCGLCSQDLWIIAARPSIGKTALALQMAVFLAKENRKVLFFSLDMPKDGLYERMIASEARINLAKVRSGHVTEEEHVAILGASEALNELPIIVSDVPATEIDIVRKTRRFRPSVVIVDFLQKVMPSNPTRNSNTDLGIISGVLKNLAKTEQMPIILLSQLTRANEREDRPPRLMDLRDSGTLEQDADLVLFLHAKDKREPGREFLIEKQRQGECVAMRFNFTGAFQIFEEA